jgi:Fur family peroxide stress response transcriptional regulator
MFQPNSLPVAVLKDFEQLCRANGMPLTVQRRAVLAALIDRDDHPTADDIFAVLKETLPGISRPTVYRVLDSLVKIGIAKKVCHPGAAARFETKLERHHHLVCVRCDKVTDFEHPAFDRLSLPDAGALGFELADYSIHFRGMCAKCARAAGAHKRPRKRRP